MTIQQAINQFQTFLVVQKQRSHHTSRSYCLDIHQFFNAQSIPSNQPPDSLTSILSIDRSVATTYLATLHQKQLSPKSISRKISALQQFWDFLIQQAICKTNPWRTIRRPRIHQKLPIYLDETTMIECLDNYPTTTPRFIRNRCILELLFASGIRISECCQLTVNDIYLSDCKCRVLGKGDKERLALFGQRCATWLRTYITTVRSTWNCAGSTQLFLSERGSAITPKTIQRIVKDANQYHSSEVIITPHSCRHSFASALLSNGAPIRDIQDLLGHSSITTTQRYANIPNKTLKNKFITIMDDAL